MAEKNYQITFIWSGPAYDRQKLQALSCDSANLTPEKAFPSRLANIWIQRTRHEALEACSTVNVATNLQLSSGGFYYMDVGCWLDGRQSFGLVCGDEAAVCRYRAQEPLGTHEPLECRRTSDGLMDEFLSFVPYITVPRRCKLKMDANQPCPNDPNTLYLILPDMHVPETPLYRARGLEAEGDPDSGHTIGLPVWEAVNPIYKRDLFHSLDSIPAIVEFLGKVLEFPARKQIRMIQIGDLYELWADRPRLFRSTEHSAVILLDDDAVKEVGAWVGGTHLLHSALFDRLEECHRHLKGVTILHGNHDNYLADERVVAAANQFIKQRTKDISRVSPGKLNINENSMFMEHGQRFDAYNHDGATDGWARTNDAVSPKGAAAFVNMYIPLPELDTTRRPSFVMGAAASWLSIHGSFGLYIMGHTHSPELRYVEIHHRRADMKYTWSDVTSSLNLEWVEGAEIGASPK